MVGLAERHEPAGADVEVGEVLCRRLDPPDGPQSRCVSPPLALGEHPRIGIDGHRLVEERCQVDDEDPRARADIEQASVTVERELALQRREQLAE